MPNPRCAFTKAMRAVAAAGAALVMGLAAQSSALAQNEAGEIDVVRGTYSALEEGRWASATRGGTATVRFVDVGFDTVLSLRVNMKQDKGASRVLGAAVLGDDQAKSSFFIEWAGGYTRAILILAPQNLSYVITRKAGQGFTVEKQPIEDAICGGGKGTSRGIPLDPAQSFAPAPSQSPVPLAVAAAAPVFNSNPGATSVILLDFDGHAVSGTFWNSGYNGGNDIIAAPFDFDGDPGNWGEAETAYIKAAFDEVADDFAPFTINVTTSEAVFQAANPASRMRVIITPTNYFFPGYGGVAFIGSFSWGSDTPVWVWNQTLYSMGETCSHEVGHAVGLFHDGGPLGFAAPEYYGGHDTGDGLHWSPIMGAYFGDGIKHWSRGEYPGANNQQDDLAVMTGEIGSGYGFGYRPDDVGDTAGTAAALQTVGTTTVSGVVFDEVEGKGVIARGTDVDVFTFVAGASGPTTLFVLTATSQSNILGNILLGRLDAEARLYDASWTLLRASNPPGSRDAVVEWNVVAGARYYLVVTGVGKSPESGYGIPDYSSLGTYTVRGTVPAGGGGGGEEPIAATKGAITVDGEVDEAWAVIAKRPLRHLVGSGAGAGDAGGAFRATWDQDFLYVLVDVQDDRASSDSSNAWEDDSVEVYLDVGGRAAAQYGPTDYQYVVRASNGAVSVGARSAPAMPGTVARSVTTPVGYRVEVAIPWNRSQGFTPQPGGALGLDVHVNDDDDGGARDTKLAWRASVDESWTNPSLFARARLVNAADVIVETAPTAPSIDGQADLVWDGARVNPLGKVVRGSGGAGTASFRTLADARALYLLVDVTDETLVGESTTAPWEDDAVELFLDLAGNGGSSYDGNDVQVVFRWNENDAFLGLRSAPIAPGGLQFAMVRTGRGYRLEVALDWAALPLVPAPGASFGLDVHVNDDDDGGARERKLAWASATDDTWQWPSLMGTALRVPGVASAQALVPLGETPPTLDGALGEWLTAFRPIDRVLAGATQGPADALAGWQALATADALFVAVRAEDDVIVRDSTFAWEDDSIEIYLDGDGSAGASYDGRNDAQWVVRLADGGVSLGVNSIAATGVTVARKQQATAAGQVVTLEVRIPWATLGGRPALDGAFGVDVHLNDDDDGGNRDGKQSWYGAADVAWTRPDTFASARLSP